MAWHSAVYRHQQNHKQSASWILLACSQLASILSIVWYLETAKETQIRFLSAKCILFMYQCVVINGLDGSKFSQLQTVTTTIFRLCLVALRDSDIKRETEASINIFCGPGHGLKKTHKKTNKQRNDVKRKNVFKVSCMTLVQFSFNKIISKHTDKKGV